MIKDKLIADLIEDEKDRQTRGIELIASENYASDSVMNAMGSVLTNKYAEGLPGKRYYGGCEVVDQVENIAIDRLKQLFNAEWANVQPHSGAQANAAVMLACLNSGDPILGFDLSHGGHLTHGSPVNFSGKLYNPHFYGVEKETGTIDYDKVEAIALEIKPKMPEIELTKINNAETAAVCFIFAQPNSSKTGLKTIPPPIPIKPDKNPITAPINNANGILISVSFIFSFPKNPNNRNTANISNVPKMIL